MRPSVEEERREQLIAAAARVIARSGYDAATVRDVAREAGVSTGVIAYYFDGKDDLFAHVLRAASRAFRARLERARRRRRDAARAPARAGRGGHARRRRGRARARAVDRLLGAGGARPRIRGSDRAAVRRLAQRDRRRGARGPARRRVPQRRRSRGVRARLRGGGRRPRHARGAAPRRRLRPTTCALPARRSSTRSRGLPRLRPTAPGGNAA